MRLLVFLLLVFAGIAAHAIWLLPLWLSLSLVVLTSVKSRSRRGHEADVFFAPKSASSPQRLPFLNTP